MVALVHPDVELETEYNDRRVFTRRPVSVSAEGKRLDHSLSALRQPRLSLAVRDLSLNGMSALSEVPLSRGEHISVRFPPRIGLQSWDAFGRVVRCEPSGIGYRVAVEFDPLPAA